MVHILRRCSTALLTGSLLVACTTSGAGPAEPSPTPSSPTTATSPSASEPGTGGTLRYGLGGNPVSIDPRFVADDEGLIVVDALFDSLVAMRGDLDGVKPAAASQWEVSDDGLTYTFDLRADATFHDGTPVVADDFVRSFQRIADGTSSPASFLAYQLSAVEGFVEAQGEGVPLAGVEAVGDDVLVIRLTHPMAEFLQVLAHPSLAPIPSLADEEPEEFEERPIGNGPFAMAEAWQPNQFIRVARSPDHHRPPRLDEVVFQIFADDQSRQQQFADFERGQIDVADVPPRSLTDAVGAYGMSRDGISGPGVLDGTTAALYAYGFNTELAPFDDPAVRRAISLLIDRDRIVQQILLDARVAADTLVPPSLPGAETGRCTHCRFDPEAARAELGLEPIGGEPTDGAVSPTEGSTTSTDAPTSSPTDEPTGSDDATDPASPGPPTATPTGTEDASEPQPTATDTEPPDDASIGPIEIVVNSGATNERIAARVAADIEAALEIEVTTRTAEPADFVDELRAGEIQLFRLGWQADYASPGAVLQPLFRSDAVGQDNLTRFSDPDVDALLDEARRTGDSDARNALYAQAEEQILDQAPVAPMFFYRQNRVVADTVEGLRIDALGYVNLSEAWKRSAP